MRAGDWGLIVLSVGLTAAANLMLRAGLDRAGGFPARVGDIPNGLLHLGAQPLFDIGLALYVAAMLVWFRVLATLPLSLAYPLALSMNLLLVTLGARVVFGETLTLAKLIGLAVIVGGIFILSRG